MTECTQCGDWHPHDRMLGLGSWTEDGKVTEFVCARCALVALKGGPSKLTREEREKYNVVIEE